MIVMMTISYGAHKSELVNTFNDAYFEETNFDLVFICKNNSLVKAHKLVLASVSEFLKQLIIDNPSNEVVHISLPDVSYRVIKLLLNYLYCGITKVNQEELIELKNVLTLLGICLPSANVTTDNPQLSEIPNFQQEINDVGNILDTANLKNGTFVRSYGSRSKKSPVASNVLGNCGVSASHLAATQFPVDTAEGRIVDSFVNIPETDPGIIMDNVNVKMERMDDESYMTTEPQYIMESRKENNLTAPPSLIGVSSESETNDIWCCRKCGHSLHEEGDYQKSIKQCKSCEEKDSMLKPKKLFHECTLCNKSFKSKWHLTQHMVVHSTSREFQCPQCEKFYKSKKHLYEHISRVHSTPKYACDQCDRVFKFIKSLHHHRRSVHTDNLFTTVILPPPDSDQQ